MNMKRNLIEEHELYKVVFKNELKLNTFASYLILIDPSQVNNNGISH